MGLIIIFGPPAVGKMTVGQAVAKKTGYKLFHNHMSIDMVIPIFPFGANEFTPTVNSIRNVVFKEAAASKDKNFKGLIFTVCWAFNLEEDTQETEAIAKIFKDQGKEVYFLELYADLDTRLQRNTTENRLQNKPTKRDLEWSESNVKQMEADYVLNSDGNILHGEKYLQVDNTDLDADAVADLFVKKLGL
jgi:adenylate kinase family enzyme